MISANEWAERCAALVEEKLPERTITPGATYRLQFRSDRLTFREAAQIVPYLADLGITHVYASPYLQARSGSQHGYDVVNHAALHAEFGTEDDYAHFIRALHEHGLGQILDIVPNHMGIAGSDNRWWNDVLENGPSSPYAHYFDIDWRPATTELHDKLMLPMLGDQYGTVLEAGQLQLEYRDGAFALRYYESSLPIEPCSYAMLLSHRLDSLREALAPDSDELLEVESVLTALEYLPRYTETAADRIAERQREKEVIKRRLARLTQSSPLIAEWIDETLRIFNGDPQDPRSFDLLDQLLGRQVYRLSNWKSAADEINYRRFFDINELAALCVEEPDVFRDVHRRVFQMLVGGQIDGLRIDHIDGLYDPEEYLWRLQQGYLAALGREAYESLRREMASDDAPAALAGSAASAIVKGIVGPASNGTAVVATGSPANAAALAEPNQAEVGEDLKWEEIEPYFLERMRPRLGGPPAYTGAPDEIAELTAAEMIWTRRTLPLFVSVEKILEHDEDLPREWPVAGTTGYDFLNVVNTLFVDRRGLPEIVKNYQRFTGNRMTLAEHVYRSKRLILHVAMSSELQLLATRLNRLSEQHRRCRDFTLNNLRQALREIIACFPVYRSYITRGRISSRDRKFIHVAVARAKRRNPAVESAIFDFVRDTLLLEQPPELDERGKEIRQFFVGRFQQVTSPVTAKGVEDTAFYRHFPLVSLNEVGGAPEKAPADPAEFHRENALRLAGRPGSLLCSTSHDTKRSEDVRARINVLSEIPQWWRTVLSRWARLNRKHRREVDGEPAPSRNDEYLFYQTLIGIWPLQPPGPGEHQTLIERLQQYMQKAIHEAKVHTSWINPDPDYDEAVSRFVAAVLDNQPGNVFLSEFQTFHEQVLDWGLYTALSQLLLKLTSPGVPDIYQGQELWDFSLVDPDNRRPVDFDLREQLLKEIQENVQSDESLRSLARQLGSRPRDERTKLFVTMQVLQFRRAHPKLFAEGDYRPLGVEGAKMRHLCAFARVAPPDNGEREDAEAMIMAAPRLLAQLTPRLDANGSNGRPPLGSEVWEDTAISLENVPLRRYRNLLTGATLDLTEAGGRLLAADAFTEFPLLLLAAE